MRLQEQGGDSELFFLSNLIRVSGVSPADEYDVPFVWMSIDVDRD